MSEVLNGLLGACLQRALERYGSGRDGLALTEVILCLFVIHLRSREMLKAWG